MFLNNNNNNNDDNNNRTKSGCDFDTCRSAPTAGLVRLYARFPNFWVWDFERAFKAIKAILCVPTSQKLKKLFQVMIGQGARGNLRRPCGFRPRLDVV